MAYDAELAERIRALVEGRSGLSEKRMFGGLAFLVNGHLAVSASSRGGMLVRVDPARTEDLLVEDGAEPFEMRGRGMAGWLHVGPAGYPTPERLQEWVDRGVDYAASLPPKG